MAYNTKIIEEARAMHELGESAYKIARSLKVDTMTVIAWIKKHDFGEKGAKSKQLAKLKMESLEEAASSVGITKRKVLQQLSNLAFGDISDLVKQIPGTNRFELKTFAEIKATAPGALARIKKVNPYTGEVELNDQMKPLAEIIKVLGWFYDPNKHDDSERVAENLEMLRLEARQRGSDTNANNE